MTDRPILFSAPMVRALLEGRKTQTRRIIKPRPWNREGDCVNIDIAPTARYTQGADGRWYYAFDHPKSGPLTAHLARLAVGDRLWVKETWSHTGTGVWSTNDVHNARDGETIYRATDDRPGAGWFPSIFMFRKFSRLTLTVTDVRVERLQDCSHVDAMAEGINCYPFYPSDDHPLCDGYTHIYPDDKESVLHPTAKQAYAALWNSINGDGAWEQNPWVVALTFDVEQRNIDQ